MPVKTEEVAQEPTKEEQESTSEETKTDESEQSEHYEGMVDDAIRGAMLDESD